MEKINIRIRINEWAHKEIKKIAAKDRRTMSSLIRKLILDHIDEVRNKSL